MVKAVCVLKGEVVNGTVYFEQVSPLLKAKYSNSVELTNLNCLSPFLNLNN